MTKFKVTAPTGFRGYREGETFEADLPPDVERRAVARGSIRVVQQKKKTSEKESEGAK